MQILIGRPDINRYMNALIDIVESMGGRVRLSTENRVSFKPDLTVTVPPVAELENLYALAHETGHLIDYIEGNLDYDSWISNRPYRINAEMKAWVNAYHLLKEMDAPLEEWEQHVQKKLFTYFQYEEVS
ncbi:hypothetical protein COJ85_21320 [Bacillus sp. AFS076308]|uniref:hypothetical protein n=1 Tax=unclassified Bacillus (in: firmicutes) TaxID=185979 RepID=UPI000BF3114C|nr:MULTISPECIES: hypothetical protein [unclassified Bacillus (in: firmicutes)]PFN98066.1 hypothetical protein COJ85_21320 [Bacillus sp. AFS076308]PGV50781.1 hypothetical protein COD92_15940 [Bacillus sp. AFS037270]